MMVYIQPYNASESAKTFAAALRNDGIEAKRLRYTNSNYNGHADDVVINWGSSSTQRKYLGKVKSILNHPHHVRNAVNKILTLKMLYQADINIPRYTTEYLQALEWIHQDGMVMAARTDIAGHSGKGICISAQAEHLPRAPLYTQFTHSRREYRVHVFNGEMIDYAKKRRKTGEPPVGIEKSIRSHNNGWIYARSNVDGTAIPIPDHFVQHAIDAVGALNLDFGGVDLLDVEGEPVVLEVNSAPGLVGETTINSYVHAVRRYLENL